MIIRLIPLREITKKVTELCYSSNFGNLIQTMYQDKTFNQAKNNFPTMCRSSNQ